MSGILDALGRKYGTDKASGSHDYLEFYERHLHWLRNSATSILEIGVGEGPSLRMWRDYFPLAHVYGMDINPETTWRLAGEERISVVLGNQGEEADLARVAALGPFDLIVDDASHDQSHQIRCHQYMLSYVKPGGVYILEDVGAQETIDYLANLARSVLRRDGTVDSLSLYLESSIARRRAE